MNRHDPDNPPFAGAAQLRCTDHDRFVAWINPPLPPAGVHVGCGQACRSATQLPRRTTDER